MLALKTGRSVPPREGGTASVRSWALYRAAGGRLRRDRVLFARPHCGRCKKECSSNIHVYMYGSVVMYPVDIPCRVGWGAFFLADCRGDGLAHRRPPRDNSATSRGAHKGLVSRHPRVLQRFSIVSEIPRGTIGRLRVARERCEAVLRLQENTRACARHCAQRGPQPWVSTAPSRRTVACQRHLRF